MGESYFEKVDGYCKSEIRLLQNEVERLEKLPNKNKQLINNDHVAITTLERVRNALTWLFD